jgi:hypothetical protein
MSELGDKYRLAEQIVLQRYSLENDKDGHSQKWRVTAIEEDRRLGRDSHILQQFAEDVEKTVDQLTDTTVIITRKQSSTNNTVIHSKAPHTVVAKAAEPIPHHDGINPS